MCVSVFDIDSNVEEEEALLSLGGIVPKQHRGEFNGFSSCGSMCKVSLIGSNIGLELNCVHGPRTSSSDYNKRLHTLLIGINHLDVPRTL